MPIDGAHLKQANMSDLRVGVRHPGDEQARHLAGAEE